MKLLGSIRSKITKDENDENEPHLEIAEVSFSHFKIVNNDSQQDLRVFCKFDPNKSFAVLLDFPLKHFIQNFHILKNGLLIKILNL